MIDEIKDYMENRRIKKEEEQKRKKDRGPNVLLHIEQKRLGIQTYAYPGLSAMNPAYKEQLKAFLQGVLTLLGGKK